MLSEIQSSPFILSLTSSSSGDVGLILGTVLESPEVFSFQVDGRVQDVAVPTLL